MATFVRWPMAVIKRFPVLRLYAFYKYHGILKRIRQRYKVTTYFGAKLSCGTHDFIEKTILLFGFWEPNISHVIDNLLNPGDVFADVGANIGYHTLLASKIVGTSGSVVSIEASPSTFRSLSKNLVCNQTMNVRAINAAVAETSGRVAIYCAPNDNVGASTTVRDRGFLETAMVDSAPLDNLLSTDELARLSLVKIDIEGAELLVLANILARIDLYPRHFKILVEASCEARAEWLKLFDDFKALGFSAYSIENEYSEDWYLSWRTPSLPRLLESLPSAQTDILFTRQQLPSSLRTATQN